MKLILVLVISLLHLISCTTSRKARTDKLSVLQGVTSSKEVEFSILSTKDKILNFELRDESNLILSPEKVEVISKNFSEYILYKVLFSKDSTKDYNLLIYTNGKIIDQRLIGKGQTDETKLKLAIVSCLSDFYSEKFKIWDQIFKKDPDYLLLIGDNIYADMLEKNTIQSVNPERLWQRYVDARLSYPLFFQTKLIPTHAIWDDHDYGTNNGDERFKYKEESKEIFEAFYAQKLSTESWSKSYGAGGLLSLGDFNLYFLDSRYFRSPHASGLHLGAEQTSWLYSKLKAELSPSLLIKGDQFFGKYHPFESFEGNHPDNFQEFISQLKLIETPIIFISGDRHLSEIMQFPRSLFGRPSFEITSSPLHAKTFGEQKDKNPWRVVAETEKNNFTLINQVIIENHWFLEVQNIGTDGKVHYQRDLSVFVKDLQNNLREIKKRRKSRRSYRKFQKRI